jgi:hypothetical protein
MPDGSYKVNRPNCSSGTNTFLNSSLVWEVEGVRLVEDDDLERLDTAFKNLSMSLGFLAFESGEFDSDVWPCLRELERPCRALEKVMLLYSLRLHRRCAVIWPPSN